MFKVNDKINGGHFFFILHQQSQQMINNILWTKFVYFYMNIYENIKTRIRKIKTVHRKKINLLLEVSIFKTYHWLDLSVNSRKI